MWVGRSSVMVPALEKRGDFDQASRLETEGNDGTIEE